MIHASLMDWVMFCVLTIFFCMVNMTLTILSQVLLI